MEAAEVPEKDSSPDELSECDGKEEVGSGKETTENQRGVHQAQIWAQIRPSLSAIEQMMSHRVKKKKFMEGGEQVAQRSRTNLAPIEESRASEDSDDEFYDVERSEPVHEASSGDEGNFDSNMNMASQGIPEETKEELECLVRGGLPMALRGEVFPVVISSLLVATTGFCVSTNLCLSLSLIVALASFCWCWSSQDRWIL